jgi:hypothetical protein
LRFPIAVSLAAACLVPIETTWSISAFAQQEAPAPALPSLPPNGDAPPESAPPEAPAPPALAKTVRVHLVTNATGVQFLFRPAPDPTSGAARGRADDILQYGASCLAPCDLELPPGDYFVALSRTGGRPYEQTTPVSLRSATTIEGTYDSHTGTRVTGIVFLSALVPIGAVIALVGANAGGTDCSVDANGISQCTTNSDAGIVAVGLISLGIGLVLGMVFVLRRDDAAVQVVPATGALAVRGAPSERPAAADGLALRFAF